MGKLHPLSRNNDLHVPLIILPFVYITLQNVLRSGNLADSEIWSRGEQFNWLHPPQFCQDCTNLQSARRSNRSLVLLRYPPL